MQENGLISVHKAKFKATTNSNHNYPVAPNLLQKDFTALAPGQKWVGDITYIPTNEGWLYLAAIEDLYHRKVVGWALGARMTKQLTIDALDQALARTDCQPGAIFHYDNACMESFCGTLKKELIYRRRFRTRTEARLAIVNYIETWYNSKRLHSGLGYMSPLEYEMKYRAEFQDPAA
jgi:putative transposase